MNTQIYDEASEWLIELQTEEVSAGMHERFAAWLDTSPEHVRAYLEVISLWEDASGVDKARTLDVEALIRLTKTERNLYSLDVSSGRDSEASTSRGPWAHRNSGRSGWRLWSLAASFTVLVASAASAWYWTSQLRGVHSTEVGEQRTLALSDGTMVELNAGTRIRERFTKTERAVDLVEGQALFRVTPDPSRPFVVRSDAVAVRAIGTQFDVHRRATGTTVTVLEGRVAVVPLVKLKDVPAPEVTERTPVLAQHADSRATSASNQVLLGAGEQVNLHDGSARAVAEPADVRVATAWTQQRLIFESTTLSDAAAEFNRFTTRKLIVDTRGLEDFKVSGTFQALDPKSLERFVSFLRDQGLVVVESGDTFRVSQNR